MAGIGFELRKLANRDDIAGVATASFSAMLVAAGPWLITVAALAALGLAASFVDSATLERFRVITSYDFAGSLVLVAPVSLTATRYVADRLFHQDAGVIPETLIGALALGFAVEALLGVPLWLYAAELPTAQRCLALIELLLLGGIWIVTGFVGALRGYSAVVRAFAIGMSLGAITALALAPRFGANGLLAGFATGLVWVLFSLLGRVLLEHPDPIGRPFAFTAYFRRYWELGVSAAAWGLGVWIDKLIMWTVPAHSTDAGILHTYITYDSATFLASLAVIPGMTAFTISIETRFYEEYRRFHRAIHDHLPYRVIAAAHERLREGLGESWRRLLILQLATCLGAALFAPLILRAIGAPQQQLGIFRLTTLGALFNSLLMCLTVMLAYFDLRRLMMAVNLLFLALNAALTLWSLSRGFAWYGYGYFLAALLTCSVAFVFVARSMARLPYLTFVGNNAALHETG